MADTAVDRASAAPGKGEPPLDDLMLAMDVVDTLRHAERLVERELSSEQRDAQLRERLREIYRSQGIDVPDRVLNEGIAALQQDRFVYHPPGPSLQRTLAMIWVRRATWGKALAWALFILIVAVGAYQFLWKLPGEERTAALSRELAQELPTAIDREFRLIQSLVRDPSATVSAEQLLAEAQAAIRDRDAAGAHRRLAALQSLRTQLEQTYNVRIVSRPNQPSGVFRIPRANSTARNYYVIVEAIDANGAPVKVRVSSEEDGRTDQVSVWGVRVDQSVYQRIRQDKLDDGIIQQNRAGEKRRGFLKPDYLFATDGGTILTW
ncbi:MAG: DUF6384 family protein [Methylotetracoccus sp.]